MAEKNTVVFYHSWLKAFRKLPRDKAGDLVVALLEYSESGKKPDFEDLALSIPFEMFAETIDRDNEKYKQKCERNKKNIHKRWNKENTTVYDRIKSNTKNTHNDNDNDNDNDIYIPPSHKTKFHNFYERDNTAIIEKLERG